MIAAADPVMVIEALLLPLMVAPVKGVARRVPLSTDTVVTRVALSTSETLIVLPPGGLNSLGESSFIVCAPGTLFTGASLTAVTLIVSVRTAGSRSTPPLALPPSSRTWKVKLA